MKLPFAHAFAFSRVELLPFLAQLCFDGTHAVTHGPVPVEWGLARVLFWLTLKLKTMNTKNELLQNIKIQISF